MKVKKKTHGWEIDESHPAKADIIRKALRQVLDPEIKLSIIELGLVRDVSLKETELHLKMILTTPFCPYGPVMLEMARTKAEEAAGMQTTIELGMEAWKQSMMEDSAASAWGLF
jgi:metal-sulfur cluster biosynthetic enzyme